MARWSGRLVAAVVSAVVALPVVAPLPPPTVHAAPVTTGSAAPDKRLYFITDSVGLGTTGDPGALRTAFGPEWQITTDGFPALFVEQMESNHVRTAMRDIPGAFGDYAVVAGGYNYPYWDPARFVASIDSIMAAFREAGVQHVFWVTLREVKPEYVSPSAWRGIQPYYWYFPTVNQHLREAQARHPDLTLIDWAAIADRPGLTYDAIHLNAYGASEYANLVASTVKAVPGRLPDGTITELDLAGTTVPDDAEAVALNLAVTAGRAPGFLAAFPCDRGLPTVANLNYVSHQTVSAAAIVPLDGSGKVCVFNSTATQLIVDVMGSFDSGGVYQRVTPDRLRDTRDTGGHAGGTELRLTMPAPFDDVDGVVLNVTAVAGPTAGFVNVYRCGDPIPTTSNLNFGPGSIVPNVAVAAPSAAGEVCFRPNQPADLVVDLFGGFDGDGVDVADPRRGLDTREPEGAPKPAAGSVIRVATGVTGAAAAFVNVTATQPDLGGFLSVFTCDRTPPPTANLNFTAGQTIGNFAVVEPNAAGEVCVFTSAPTHVVVDVMGTLGSGFDGLPQPVRAFDSRLV
jgi:hypothetical protein